MSQFKEYIQQIQNLEDNDEKFGLEKDMTNGLLLLHMNIVLIIIVDSRIQYFSFC